MFIEYFNLSGLYFMVVNLVCLQRRDTVPCGIKNRIFPGNWFSSIMSLLVCCHYDCAQI